MDSFLATHLHPFFVSFPIVLVLLLVLFELIQFCNHETTYPHYLHRTVVLFLLLGIVAAFVSGYWAVPQRELAPEEIEAIALHHTLGRFALIGLALYGVLFFIAKQATVGRKKLFDLLRFFLLLFAVLLGGTGYLGRELVAQLSR